MERRSLSCFCGERHAQRMEDAPQARGAAKKLRLGGRGPRQRRLNRAGEQKEGGPLRRLQTEASGFAECALCMWVSQWTGGDCWLAVGRSFGGSLVCGCFGWANWEKCSSAPCIQAPRDMRAQVVRLHRSATPGHASECSSFWLSRFGLTFAHAVVFPRSRRLGGGVRWVSLGMRARA